MTNVNDLQSMERFIDKKIEPLNKQISMLQIELNSVKQQLSIPRCCKSDREQLLSVAKYVYWNYDESSSKKPEDYLKDFSSQ
jgi:hypothetical protein